ncbi:uncharacterized protein KY384_007270 [Bacidia gigantensis]|uniref:uncharacterized protein n=1 Tax=Bacidia gigantensis TaxID=2732470 RepID=UPI001D0441EE|nr:uncharacterized protein KY384_007270 [Bacidia gigantensis]KAG8528352.1 hypothetical protein KY384_007270 [Bacidia gigantensis]
MTAGNFSCTNDSHASSLDAIAASVNVFDDAKFPYRTHGDVTSRLSMPESSLTFGMNETVIEPDFLVPNRQALRQLSLDYLKASEKYPQSWGEVSLKSPPCFRTGKGFNHVNNIRSFWIGSNDSRGSINVDVFFADMVTFWTDTDDFGTGIRPCLTHYYNASCDWDFIFSDQHLPEYLKCCTDSNFVSSYSLPISDSYKSEARFFLSTQAYMHFPLYQLDISKKTNPTLLVQFQNTGIKGGTEPVVIHPDWFLAAWSVDNNGTVDGYRGIAQSLFNLLPSTSNSDSSEESLIVSNMCTYVLFQTLTMPTFANTSFDIKDRTMIFPSSAANASSPHVLETWAIRNVWTYGLNSRTAYWGIAVVLLGCLIVITKLIVGAKTSVIQFSPIEMLIAAVKFEPRGEFTGLGKTKDRASIRFSLQQETDDSPEFVSRRRVGREQDYAE